MSSNLLKVGDKACFKDQHKWGRIYSVFTIKTIGIIDGNTQQKVTIEETEGHSYLDQMIPAKGQLSTQLHISELPEFKQIPVPMRDEWSPDMEGELNEILSEIAELTKRKNKLESIQEKRIIADMDCFFLDLSSLLARHNVAICGRDSRADTDAGNVYFKFMNHTDNQGYREFFTGNTHNEAKNVKEFV